MGQNRHTYVIASQKENKLLPIKMNVDNCTAYNRK